MSFSSREVDQMLAFSAFDCLPDAVGRNLLTVVIRIALKVSEGRDARVPTYVV